MTAMISAVSVAIRPQNCIGLFLIDLQYKRTIRRPYMRSLVLRIRTSLPRVRSSSFFLLGVAKLPFYPVYSWLHFRGGSLTGEREVRVCSPVRPSQLLLRAAWPPLMQGTSATLSNLTFSVVGFYCFTRKTSLTRDLNSLASLIRHRWKICRLHLRVFWPLNESRCLRFF
jgi:hypothetical protein